MESVFKGVIPKTRKQKAMTSLPNVEAKRSENTSVSVQSNANIERNAPAPNVTLEVKEITELVRQSDSKGGEKGASSSARKR